MAAGVCTLTKKYMITICRSLQTYSYIYPKASSQTPPQFRESDRNAAQLERKLTHPIDTVAPNLFLSLRLLNSAPTCIRKLVI